MPKPLSKSILESLKERNPELSQSVLQKMFTFEDLERLDSKILQKILQAVESRTLTVALKGASQKGFAKLFPAFPNARPNPCAKKSVSLARSRRKKSKAAQAQIIAAVRQLELKAKSTSKK